MKIMKNDALGASGGLWGGSRFQECDFGAHPTNFWAILEPLGPFGGAILGAKMVQKWCQKIDRVGAESAADGRRKSSKNGGQK